MAQNDKIYNGLLGSSYDMMSYNIDKNAGNLDFNTDSFGTPITESANIDYGKTVPFFKQDDDKNSYGLYTDYVSAVYGSTFNWLNGDLSNSKIKIDAKVGVVDDFNVYNALGGNIESNNSNSTFGYVFKWNLPGLVKETNDTLLGKTSNYIAANVLYNAASENDKRHNAYRVDGKDTILNKAMSMVDELLSNRIIKIKDDESKKEYEKNKRSLAISDKMKKSYGLTIESLATLSNRFRYSTDGRVHDTNLYDDSYSPVYRGSEISLDGKEDDNAYGGYIGNLTSQYEAYFTASMKGIDLYSGNEDSRESHKKKYGAYVDGMRTYLEDIVSCVKFENNKRFTFNIIHDLKTLAKNWHQTYAEKPSESQDAPDFVEYNNGGTFSSDFQSFVQEEERGLIAKTNNMFRNGEIRTLIGRFHTSNFDENFESTTQTAISNKYGMSHGRNLLKTTPNNENGYDNPYCRVWTYHHQYDKLNKAIRPFSDGDKEPLTQWRLSSQNNWKAFRNDDTNNSLLKGSNRLDKYSVLNSNGFVNISPTSLSKDQEARIKARKCMFSIENLAWKGSYTSESDLSSEQRGPLGGRIMWFPPYDLNFTENVNVNHSSTSFIGRGENIYTYVNTERTGTLSFLLMTDHPSIVDYRNKNHSNTDGNVDDIHSDEQTLLRFFAGCDVLYADNIKLSNLKEKKENNEENAVVERTINNKDSESPSTKPSKTIRFNVFFPNNYSGRHDDAMDAMAYLFNGLMCGSDSVINTSSECVSRKIEAVDINEQYQLNDGTVVGGYEMNSVGISLGITNMSDEISTVPINGYDYNASKIKATRGARDFNYSSNDKKFVINKSYYCYRVDAETMREVLDFTNLIDSKSWSLNSHNYEAGDRYLKTNVDNKETYANESILYSFADVFAALTYNCKDRDALSIKKKELVEFFRNDDLISQIRIIGSASKEGIHESNKTLAKHRSETVKKWLAYYFPNNEIITSTCDIITENRGSKKDKVNSLESKATRCATVEIDFTDELVFNQSDSVKIDKNVSNGLDKKYDTIISSKKKKKEIRADILNGNLAKMRELVKGELTNDKYEFKPINMETKRNNTVDDSDDFKLRYDYESEFFETLKINEPFLHHKITEKVKYFDPAFHSMTPEGLNARLTFLHQCTRQGSTVGGSDKNSKTTSNLAFGRQPVCVLRLGDFYNTKILITHIDITPDNNIQWDMNPEGIGVMPMFMKVNISFTFLGGSSLGGPISRLQNALSFNYYANTEVYDNRAEQVEYKDDNSGEIELYKAYDK